MAAREKFPPTPPGEPVGTTRRKAFTLVELLVVIGIIALLISILMPALNRAREQANQVKCLSNLRQVGMAFHMYANENKGFFPLGSRWDVVVKEDWLYYQRGTGGGTRPAGSTVNDSPIAKYMNGINPESLRCPSDEWQTRPNVAPGGPYDYSYVMNEYFEANRVRNPVAWGGQVPKLGTIRNASDKVLLAEEDERTINDGLFAPPMDAPPSSGYAPRDGGDMLAIRHDRTRKNPDPPGLPPLQQNAFNAQRRGNAAFADGHAEYVTRKELHNIRRLHPFYQ